MHKLHKRVTTLPKNLLRGEKEIFDKINPFIISGLNSVFCLDCRVEWKLTDTTQSGRHFTLYAGAQNGEVKLGEYPLSKLEAATQEQINSMFASEQRQMARAKKKTVN
jgi:hypothetical protein